VAARQLVVADAGTAKAVPHVHRARRRRAVVDSAGCLVSAPDSLVWRLS
jgi:hypothetical protein